MFSILFHWFSESYKSKEVTDTIAENAKGNCTQEMFPIKSDTGKVIDFDKAALLSCQAEYALQRNWYPDPIGGLFSYQTWNGMDGFWQNGLAIEAMTNAMIYGNHTRYMSVVKVTYNYVVQKIYPNACSLVQSLNSPVSTLCLTRRASSS